MPVTIASCCSEPSRPRRCAGAISAMYVGAITDADPIARPPTKRQSMSPPTLPGNAEPIAEIMKSTAATRMAWMRPRRSAMRPAYQAPTAQPSSAMLTMKPVCAGLVPYCAAMPGTAALMTEESKPKRKPPRAATTETPITRPLECAGAAATPEVSVMAPIMDPRR